MNPDAATFCIHPSPIGELFLVADSDGLRHIEFPENRHAVARDPAWIEGDNAVLAETRRQLDDYFAGDITAFDLALSPRGTPFQQSVWTALRQIPFGATCSYADIAHAIGKPAAVRAVGAANGRNPLPIVVPCHRVIGADGSLTGFGGGLPTKRFLLQLEGIQLHEQAELIV